MADLFLDSSAVVKRYAREVGTTWVRSVTSRAAGNALHVSRLTGVEVVSGLVRHVPPLSPHALARALVRFRAAYRRRFHRVPVSGAVIAHAMALAARHRLRGSDAVQLASALAVKRQNDTTGAPAPILVSADTRLNAAAVAEGFAVVDPNLHP